MQYREVSSAQILLVELDDTAFVRYARGSGLMRFIDGIATRFRRRDHKRRPGRTLRDSFVVRAAVLGAVTMAVILCFGAALLWDLSPREFRATEPLAPILVPPPAQSSPRARIIDSEPHGAAVMRGRDVLGSTPFLYDMSPTEPLGTIIVRLDGYEPEVRFVGGYPPSVLMVKLRAR